MTHSASKPYKLPAAAAAGFALMWAAAAWGKIRDPLGFADSVHAFRLLPDGAAVSAVALGLPWLELALAGMLAAPLAGPGREGRWRRTGWSGSVLLLAGFTGVLGWAVWKGLTVDCGCFGGGSWLNLSPAAAIVRNLALLTAGVWMLHREVEL